MKSFITHTTEDYIELTEKLLKSISLFSKKQIICYTVNFDWDIDLPHVITKRYNTNRAISKAKFEGDNKKTKGYINRFDLNAFKINSTKPYLMIDALDNGITEGIYLDGDQIANHNIDSMFDYFSDMDNFPLVAKGIFDMMMINGKSDIERPLMDKLGVPNRGTYLQTCALTFNENCRWFINEWIDLNDDTDILSNPGLYAPFQDETTCNVLLWKYKYKKHLPSVSMNVLNNETVKYYYKHNETGKDYVITDDGIGHKDGWNKIPYPKNTVKVFHGCKKYNECDRIITTVFHNHTTSVGLPSEKSFKKSLIDIYDLESDNTHKVIPKSDVYHNLTFKTNFIKNPFFELLGEGNHDYEIKFLDPFNNSLVHKHTVKPNHWVKANRQYFTPYNIVVTDKTTGNVIHNYTYNADGKRVYIHLDSKSLGDNLAWFPYVEEFRKKHNCEVICSTFWNDFFKETYPHIEFVEPATRVQNLYAMYTIGCWDGDTDRNPYHWRKTPQQRIATDILGLDYKEIKPKLKLGYDRPIDTKYVCFSPHSTAGAKYWNYDGGWQEVIDYLNSIGYKVVLISKEKSILKNLIDDSGDHPIERRMQYLEHCDFYMGIGSGLSWLAWACNAKTLMISGFSEEWCEFKADQRLINKDVCNGCWNKPEWGDFERGNWNWCPKHEGTPRQFECTKSITPKQVIESINKMRML